MNIKVSEFTQEAASKAKGLVLKEKIVEQIGTPGLIIDFSGIVRYASPFFNNSFSALALVYGFEAIEKIELIGMDRTGKDVYEASLENAKLLADSPQYVEEINNIVNTLPKKEGV